MHTPRFLLSFSEAIEDEISSSEPLGCLARISGTNLHHLKNVLRLKPRDLIEVFDSESQNSFLAELEEFQGEYALARILKIIPQPTLPRVSLLVATLKAAKADLVVEKSVELGLSRVVFFGAVKGRGNFENRLGRLERVREAALKQSHSGVMTGIDYAPSLEQALLLMHRQSGSSNLAELRLLLDNSSEQAVEIASIFRAIDRPLTDLEKHSGSADSYLIVGPESGFVPVEHEIARSFKYQSVNLGPNTLRAETAAIVAAAVAMTFGTRT